MTDPHPRDTWKQHAACRDVDVAVFFPPTNSADDTATAKRICADCTVRPHCLDAALAKHEHHGIWAGLDEHELDLLRRKRQQWARGRGAA